MNRSDSDTAKDPLTRKVIGLAIEVHRRLGPGLLESAYEECLCWEMTQADLDVQRQVTLPISYKGVKLDAGYRLDILVEGRLILEVKAVKELLPIHEAQLLTYMKLSGISIGLLRNFNVKFMKYGIKRMVL